MVLSECVIPRLPFPYAAFERLSAQYTFFRIVVKANPGKENSYNYLLFSCLPVGRLYSERAISGVNVEEMLEKLTIPSDCIPTDADGDSFGNIYLQVDTHQLRLLIA